MPSTSPSSNMSRKFCSMVLKSLDRNLSRSKSGSSASKVSLFVYFEPNRSMVNTRIKNGRRDGCRDPDVNTVSNSALTVGSWNVSTNQCTEERKSSNKRPVMCSGGRSIEINSETGTRPVCDDNVTSPGLPSGMAVAILRSPEVDSQFSKSCRRVQYLTSFTCLWTERTLFTMP